MTGRKLGLRKRIGLRLFSDLYAEKIAEHKLPYALLGVYAAL